MEANQVIDKILSDAKAETDKIKAKADEELAQVQAKYDQELASYKQETERLCEEKGEEKRSHMLAAARMEIAKDMLWQKRAILDEVFEEAKGQMHKLGEDEYREIMTKLMTEAVETGDEEVIVDKDEKVINQAFIKQINRQLGAGYKGNLRIADETADIGGGFILKRGRIKTNASFDVMLDQSRKELETRLSEVLFGSSEE